MFSSINTKTMVLGKIPYATRKVNLCPVCGELLGMQTITFRDVI